MLLKQGGLCAIGATHETTFSPRNEDTDLP